MLVKKFKILFQALVKELTTFCHSSCQLVPNPPRMTFTRLPMMLSTFWIVEMTPFHKEEKMPVIPCQKVFQSPVNRPLNVSKIPVMTPNTVSRMMPIWSKAPWNKGPSKLQNPVQIAPST